MYAVLVIAALLLSIAPMHAQAILAALPQIAPRPLAEFTLQSHPAPQIQVEAKQRIPAPANFRAEQPRPAATRSAFRAPGLILLDHAPNAP